ncbi:leucine-rich repeat-containing protein 15-like [Topomyia yanbarensis]|uniref:leucine-rich repeat-containing protein 15-like n=1 Tax=Topomyia yanbarensis TaxID=2498891 RepID=UPI00273B271D|nr:leucine-rich repeat-containing protein 15-like [Topomyia yanbarensis]
MKFKVWFGNITLMNINANLAFEICQEYYGVKKCGFNNVNIDDLTESISFCRNYNNYCHTVQFLNSKTIEIPMKIFSMYSNLQSLDISFSGVQSANPNTFEDANKLILLNMSTNSLKELQNYAFSGANSLKILDLGNNQISSIDEKTFFNLTILQSLFLSNNQLKVLKKNVFDTLETLSKLDLQNNQLISLEQDLFNSVNFLDYLWLKNNSLTSLEFTKLNVNMLNAMNNQLKTIQVITGMQELYLSHNNIYGG